MRELDDVDNEAIQDAVNMFMNIVITTGTLTEKEIVAVKNEISQKYHLQRFPQFSAVVSASPAYLRPLIRLKPVRTASGVAVVAVMCAPHHCPHQTLTGSPCIYCPGGPSSEEFIHSSQSYTGREPTSLRAINARYNPLQQTRARLAELAQLGHDGVQSSKVELILMGGTFMSLDKAYREWFIMQMHDGVSGARSRTLQQALAYAEVAPRSRCIGLTIETRPDYCLPQHIRDMLSYGTTRIEVGLQSVYEDVILDCHRGHTLRSVHRCFDQSREAGIKITAHMMPNLPNTPLRRDLWGFRELFEQQRFRPDGLKLYPTLVMAGTELMERWRKGEHRVFPPAALSRLIQEIFALSPPWTRVYRVQRDIPLELITDGAADPSANSRESAMVDLRRSGRPCSEVRSRETGIRTLHLAATRSPDTWARLSSNWPQLARVDYAGSAGWETFLSVEGPCDGSLMGLLRLRQCRRTAITQPELAPQPSSMVRELHVYGAAMGLGVAAQQQMRELGSAVAQHSGVGALLMRAAENIAAREHRSEKLAVISGIGVREYYAKLGYEHDGVYMSRTVCPPQLQSVTTAADIW